MKYSEYLSYLLPVKGAQAERYGDMWSNGTKYPLMSIVVPGEPWLYIFSGFHGDEPAGPMTLLTGMDKIVSMAKERGIGLRVFPCVNPIGFEQEHRYSGTQKQNNYFFQYKLEDGSETGELPEGQTGRRIPRKHMPKETLYLGIKLSEIPKPTTFLDIHQDGDIKGRRFYVYSFDKEALMPIMAKCRQWATPAANVPVSTGGDVTPRKTDRDGFVLNWHDCSLSDWYYYQRVPFIATLETAITMPPDATCNIQMAWVEGMMDLTTQGAGSSSA